MEDCQVRWSLTRDERAETATFHAGIMIACYFVLRSLDLIEPLEPSHPSQVSGIRREFRSAVIADQPFRYTEMFSDILIYRLRSFTRP